MAKSVNDITSTTQQYLDIYDVSNDFLILKDGSTSLILTVSAMNFGLLAEEEQDAIMYAYAGLLNSLNYPIQIVIRSQTKDVTSYLQLLKDEEDKTVSDTRRNWITRYRQFVGELIKERNVLDKKFYVAIPASNLEMGLLPPSTVVPGVKQIDISKIERSVILEKAREILEPKRDYLIAQFGRIGLQSRQLTTQEIIQFFYLSYNPEAAEGQQITDTNSYTTAMVQASMQGGFMDNVTTQPMATPVAGANQAQQPSTMTGAPMTTAVQPSMPQPEMPQQVIPQPQVNPADVIGGGNSGTMPAQPQVEPMGTNSQTAPATPSMPTTTTAPATPSMPISGMPNTGMSSTSMTGAQPSSGDQPASGAADIQNEINSTLQEMGQSGSTTPSMPVTPATPAMSMPPITPAAPSMSMPQTMPPQSTAPMTPSMPLEPVTDSTASSTLQAPQVLPEI